MKIAIFTDTFTPQINGVVTATINLAKGLADRNHRVFIICPRFKNLENEFKYKNIDVIRVPSIPARFYEDFRFSVIFNIRLLKRLKKEKIDIIHFQIPMPLGAEAIIFSKMLKTPLVGTFHTFFGDPQYLKHVKLDFKAIERLSWIYARAFYDRCDLVTSPSETTKKELIDNGFKREIKVISNGIDPEIFDNSNYKKIKNKYNPKGEILLFVGRIAHEKNIFYLLEIFSLVVKKIPNVKLLLIGGGPQMQDIKNKINELNITKNIILAGKIPHEVFVKSSIFKACKLFITASLTENQPMTLLEAEANGLVCVGINKRGIKTLIKNNYNGYLVKENDKKEFAEKIISLLKNKKLYQKMKKNTDIEIKKHLLKNIAKNWEDEYKILLKNKNGRKIS